MLTAEMRSEVVTLMEILVAPSCVAIVEKAKGKVARVSL